MLDVAIMKSRPRFILNSGCGMGSGVHISRAREKANAGAAVNMIGDDGVGRMGSLTSSLIPSAMGCSRPCGPIVFGPFRSCVEPMVFRSRRVRKAIAISAGIMIEIRLRAWVIQADIFW